MSGTRQGTHERIPLSARKDVRSKSNEDQNARTDLRTCTPHYTSSRGTTALTGLVLFSFSFKADKVKGFISYVCAWIKKRQFWDKRVKTSKDGQLLCLFSLSVSLAQIAPQGNLIFYSLCAWKCFLSSM